MTNLLPVICTVSPIGKEVCYPNIELCRVSFAISLMPTLLYKSRHITFPLMFL